MKKGIMIVCILVFVAAFTGCGSEGQTSSAEPVSIKEDSSVLIAYFTRAGNIDETDKIDASTGASINLIDGDYVGNTEVLAQWIQEGVGGELWPIRTEEPYSSDYDVTVERGQMEKDEGARPKLARHIKNIDDYDVIFLGFPNWWYDMPMAVYSFLEEYDLSGKTVIPFCTSGGSGFSDTLETIENMEPDIKLAEGLEVRDNDALQAETHVEQWLKKLGFSKETKGETGMKITVETGGKQFEASINDSETSRAIRDMLPLTMDMTDLHGNEKFYNLPHSLPTEEENVKAIHTGDLMLFGSDCLVLFYEDFQSSYSYTRIGSVDDASGLADALGRGSTKVTLGMAD